MHSRMRIGSTLKILVRESKPVDWETIFEQYTSYLGANDRAGGGLGLAISKLVVSAHGGRIWAASATKGAMFSFVLPFEPRSSAGRPGMFTETNAVPTARAV